MACPLGFRKMCFLLTAITCLLIVLGGAFLQQAPPEQLLAANDYRSAPGAVSRRLQTLRSSWEAGTEEVAMTAQEASYLMWQLWSEEGRHVIIGTVYNSCDLEQRITVGKLVLEPDMEDGGVKVVLHLNISFEHQLDSGQMYFKVYYKAKELYNSYWDICTVDDAGDISCPIKRGPLNLVKDFSIPKILPSGVYSLKAHVVDQEERVQICADVEFTL